MIVVDASIIAFYLIEGARTKDVNALREVDAEWLVPSFWCVEFQGVLWKYVRLGGMPTEKALELLDQAQTLFSANEVTPPPERVLGNALAWGITVHDAQYVSLARQLGVRCVTENVPIRKACPDIAMSVKDFIVGSSGGRFVREPRAVYRARRRRKD